MKCLCTWNHVDSCGRTGWTQWTLLADPQPGRQTVIATVQSPCIAIHWCQVAASSCIPLQNRAWILVRVPHRIAFCPIPIPTACAHVSFGTRTQTIQVEHLASFSLFAIVFLSGKGPRGRRERRNKPEPPKKWLVAFLLRTTRTMAGYPWAPIRDRLWGLRYFALVLIGRVYEFMTNSWVY